MKHALFAGAIAGLVLASVPALAGTLSIPGLDASNAPTIEVQSWSWGTSNSSSREAGSGMATGRRQYEPIRITKRIDKASPLLARACASGKHFPKATVVMNGKTLQVQDVFLSACSSSGGSESFSLNFQKIEYER